MRKLNWFIRIIALLCILGLLVWTGLFCTVYIAEGRIPEPQQADCIIVLGARVNPNGQPSMTLQRRLEKALSCYEQGLAPAIIVCGGQGSDEPMSEAENMQAWLVQRGVPAEAIYREAQSTSTEENLRYAKQIMQEQGMRSCIVTTNAYHLTRALWIACDVGLDAQGAAAANNITLLTRVRLRMREAISWAFYFLHI